MSEQLTPIENMILIVAKAQVQRRDSVEPNTAAMLCATIERLVGIRNDDYEPLS